MELKWRYDEEDDSSTARFKEGSATISICLINGLMAGYRIDIYIGKMHIDFDSGFEPDFTNLKSAKRSVKRIIETWLQGKAEYEHQRKLLKAMK